MVVRGIRKKLIQDFPFCHFCGKQVTYDDSGLFNLNNKNSNYRENGIHIGTVRVLACLNCIYEKRYPSPNFNNASRNQKRRKNLLDKDPHCYYCKKELNLFNSTLDHLIARSKNKGNFLENKVLSCYSCNNRKGNKSAGKFLKLLAKEKEQEQKKEQKK